MDITPVTNMAEGFSFMAWLMVGTYLDAWIVIYRLPAIGAFVTPLALTITVSALLVPGRLDETAGRSSPSGLLAHVTVAFLGMAFFAVAAGVAVMYLSQERQLEGKKSASSSRGYRRFKSWMESTAGWCPGAFVLLSVTIARRVLRQGPLGSILELGPKEALSLVAWAIVEASFRPGSWRAGAVVAWRC